MTPQSARRPRCSQARQPARHRDGRYLHGEHGIGIHKLGALVAEHGDAVD
jgi:hypothetical protein